MAGDGKVGNRKIMLDVVRSPWIISARCILPISFPMRCIRASGILIREKCE